MTLAIPDRRSRIWFLPGPRDAPEVAMTFPKTLTSLVLVAALLPARPARARRKNVAQGPHFGPAAFPSACVDSALSLQARQEFHAPRSRPARAGVAASLPRHGGVPMGSGQVPPPLRRAALKDAATSLIPAPNITTGARLPHLRNWRDNSRGVPRRATWLGIVLVFPPCENSF